MNSERNLICCTDEELLHLLGRNDKSAFAILFDRYSTNLYLYIKRIVLTHTSGTQAQHETQKILIDVFTSITGGSSLMHPSPFTLEDHLFTSAYNRAIDYVCTDTELHS
jgi:hypothetical protein